MMANHERFCGDRRTVLRLPLGSVNRKLARFETSPEDVQLPPDSVKPS